MSEPGTFETLIAAIEATSAELTRRAKLAVNTSLTLRNWLIGCYIVEYEQVGADRAAYGDKLLPTLALRLAGAGMGRVDARELRRYRSFYRVYPQIRDAVTPDLPEAGNVLLAKLSFTHFVALTNVEQPIKRRCRVKPKQIGPYAW